MRLPGTAAERIDVRVALRCALAVAGVLIFFSGLDNWVFLAYGAPKPVLLVIAFVAIALGQLVVDPDRPTRALRSPLAAWLLFYFLMTTIWAWWMRGDPRVIQVLHDRYRSIGFLTAFVLLLDEPRARRAGVIAAVVVLGIAALTNVAEALGLFRFEDGLHRIDGRASGFYINANDCGLTIVLGMAATVVCIPRAWRLPLLLMGALGVAATFSRGAEVCLVALLMWLVWRKSVSAWPAVIAAVLIAGFLVFAGDAVVAWLESKGTLNEGTWARLNLEQSDSGRAHLALKAWRMFADSPLVGNGLGSTVTWGERVSSHNMFLNLAGDHGLLGLLALPALGLALVIGNRGAAPFSLTLMLAAFFSHNLLDSRFFLMAIALAAGDPRRSDQPDTNREAAASTSAQLGGPA